MKLSTATKQMMHIAIVESDPLRSIGFRALLESESDFDLIAAALPEMLMRQNIDLVLLGEVLARIWLAGCPTSKQSALTCRSL
jgi:DNA-binding NarL/FixJ family response regulator